MPSTIFPAASEFPDANKRHFLIHGHDVAAEIYKKVEGEKETVSAVYIRVSDKQTTDIITDTIDDKNCLTCTSVNPIPSRSHSGGFFVIDPNGHLSAGQILDEVDNILTYLQGKQRLPLSKPEPDKGMRKELTASDSPTENRLLRGVFDAFKRIYPVTKRNEGEFRSFMKGVNSLIVKLEIQRAIEESKPSLLSRVLRKNLPISIKGRVDKILTETGLETEIMGCFRACFHTTSLPPTKEGDFEAELETALRAAITQFLPSGAATEQPFKDKGGRKRG